MKKLIPQRIEKGRIRLRLLEESDLPMTLRWRNQDHIRKWFVHSEVISAEQHQEWFKQYLERDNDYVFIIEETRNFHKPVGQISLYNIDWKQRRADYGRLLIGEPNAQGKGIAKKANYLLLHYAFAILGLNKVELEVFTDNEPAIAIYRGCRFREVSELNGLKKMVKMRE
jgi:diamine N-acetyltransferase